MNAYGIQRSRSDIPLAADTDELVKAVNTDGGGGGGGSLNQHEPRSVQCECCGLSEDCTPTYIGRVRESFHGKWVCGLCSEAVKELQRRVPALTVDEALESHMSLCKKFNSTIRLNPKLSLASSMRDIARKSSQNRNSPSCGSKISRSSSCCPLFDLKTKQSSPLQ